MALAVVDQAVASQNHTRVRQRHTDIRLGHHVADRQALREITAHLLKGLLCAALALVLALHQLAGAVVAVVPLQPAVVIGRRADARGERKIGIAVAQHVKAVHAVAVNLAKKLFHLAEAAHRADVRDLHRNVIQLSRLRNLGDSAENPSLVVAHMRRNELAALCAAAGRLQKFLPPGAGHIAKAVADAGAAVFERLRQFQLQLLQLCIRNRRVLIRSADLLAEELVAREHHNVHRRAVAVDNVQILHRVIDVDAAVAANGRRYAHAQHRVKDAPRNFPVPDGVFMHVNVDKAGADHAAGRVNDTLRVRAVFCDCSDLPVFQQHVQLRLHVVGRVNDEAIFNQRFHIRASSQ